MLTALSHPDVPRVALDQPFFGGPSVENKCLVHSCFRSRPWVGVACGRGEWAVRIKSGLALASAVGAGGVPKFTSLVLSPGQFLCFILDSHYLFVKKCFTVAKNVLIYGDQH